MRTAVKKSIFLPADLARDNPMTQQRALATEVSLAEELRSEGYAVWQN